jgi:hypothetical protein
MMAVLLTQCGIFRKVAEPGQEPVAKDSSKLVGMEGLMVICKANDTISSVLIRKAEALFINSDQRYEALVSIYAIKDSLIYISAVNSGFEIIRAAVDRDSIRVIDRINKIVYSSAVKKRLGYQNPINFSDVQNLVSTYYLCDNMNEARELNFFQLEFHFNEPGIKKSIQLDRETLIMDKFEFVNTETGKYFMGERSAKDFKIYSNFMINEVEIDANGGEVSYNQSVEVKMEVNRRKYSFVNF